ncbi:MAG: hypothetical protein ABFS38_06320 [Bacteroidota bacterium]
MKSITYLPLYHYYFKYLGLLLCLVGLGLLLLVNPQYQLLSYIGLLIIVFSKEKSESDFTEAIRAEVFKSVFGFTISLAIALQLTELFSESFTVVITPFLIIGLPLLLYLLMFYITLIIKININSDQDLAENLKNHRRFYLIWFIIILAIAVLFIVRLFME